MLNKTLSWAKGISLALFAIILLLSCKKSCGRRSRQYRNHFTPGSPQVAINANDAASFGDYFQWGRWDDGQQATNSTAISGSLSLQNPPQISSGNPNFIKGNTASTTWRGTGGANSNTWSGTTASATNGKDVKN